MLLRPPRVVSGITAATTQTQGQGTQTAAKSELEVIYEVSVCANANDTITLSTIVPGRTTTVINNGAQTLRVFPPTGGNFTGSAANAAVNVAAGAVSVFKAYTATAMKKVN